MAAKVKVRDLVTAVLVATVLGVGLGLGVGFGARALGWPTTFVGPLTGGVVSALVVIIYQLRAKDRDSAA